ncbi:MAG: S46 family peptidase [Deltaproteobacteria bacterium]|nr:S46 family peptidase [Deltaproteobacteria bacterium]
MKRTFFSTIVLIMLYSPGTFSTEGMFLTSEIPKNISQRMRKDGLLMNPSKIDNLKKAIIKVARGGSGSFISPQGLLITNHHVAYRCLATLNATKKHRGILKKGYYAKDKTLEIPCPGYDLLVVSEITDVTSQVTKGIKKKSSLSEKSKIIAKNTELLADKCTKKQFYCEIDSFQNGHKFFMTTYINIKDVRLVYAPSLNLGKFGGDIDNWRFPRHTADFTFLRAWVSPDGKTTDYSIKNVPYKPEKFLKISEKGISMNSFTMVLGFPGRTDRFSTSKELTFMTSRAVPARLKYYGSILKILENSKLDTSPYEGLKAGLNNAVKYYGDLTKNLKKINLISTKISFEKNLKKNAGKNIKELHSILSSMDTIYTNSDKWYEQFLIYSLFSRITSSVKTSFILSRWDRLKKMKSVDRSDDLFKDRNLYRLKNVLQSTDLTSSRKVESEIIYYLLVELGKKFPNDSVLKSLEKLRIRYINEMKREAKNRAMTFEDYYRFSTVKDFTNDKIRQLVHILFSKTAIFSWTRLERELKRTLSTRMKYFNLPSGKLRKIKDPLVEMGIIIDEEMIRLKKKNSDFFKKLPMVLKQNYVMNFIKPSYYDANFTMRLSFGLVDNYTESSTGKKHQYLTSFKGMIAKFKGKQPFNLSPAIRALGTRSFEKSPLFDKHIKDIPLNFTTKLDTTGGNSGSAVLNGQGELIGLLFDGTPESIVSDYIYRKDQRSICFDIRFALFLLKNHIKGTRLLNELNIK